jgi:glutathione peroxidase
MSKKEPKPEFYDFEIKDAMNENTIKMSSFKGLVVMCVNVASGCGFTDVSYKQLTDLADRYYERGLRIVLTPSDQFKQEPNSSEQVCSMATNYSKHFIVTEKVKVNGKEGHPLWLYLQNKCGGFLINKIKWNFTKFLINRDGKPVSRHAPNEEPKSFTEEILNLLDQQPTPAPESEQAPKS